MKPDTKNVIAPGVLDKLQQEMQKLEAALKADDPDMPAYLRESHKVLVSHPETAHLLDDEEINLLIRAAEQHTKVQIIAEVAKKKASTKTRASDMDISDL
jgi:hypothetical protein